MKQMNIILDFATGRIRIPRDVVVAVGASADFGLMTDMESMRILITRNNPFVAQRTRRVGRKPKHRSNMDCWNEANKAFEISMGVLWRPFRISLGLALRDQGQYYVSGSMISDDAAVFDLADATEIIPEHDLSGFETVPPSSFNRMTAEKGFTDNNSGAGDCTAPEKEKRRISMDRNTVTNRIPNAPRPLSLEEAIAMAPPEASSPFTASTAAIAWGAVRSGQSVWEFLIGMTREFEEKLQASYEAWKAENAWYPAGFAHADGEAVGSGEVTSSDPVSDTADDIVTTGTAEGDTAPAFQSVANDTASGPVDKPVKSSAPEPERSAELRTILESLPKDPDPALYATILAGRDRESLITDVKAMIDRRKRIHRPRTALIAFLNWLEGLA